MLAREAMQPEATLVAESHLPDISEPAETAEPSCCSAPLAAVAPDYGFEGPYAHLGMVTVSSPLDVTVGSKNRTCRLQLTVTLPKLGQSSRNSNSSLPLVLMLNGFQLPASFYSTYALRLASWGYAVLQYDLPTSWVILREVIRDDEEAALLPQLVTWVQLQSEGAAGSPLSGAVNVTRLAVAGHSRGAKLAALMVAGDTSVRAAVLIDPVDISLATRKMGYPSAVEALKGKGCRVALIGAGISSGCNPPDESYAKFWPVLGAGTWQMVIPQAGHMQLTDASGAAAWALDHVLCKAGKSGHEEVMALADTAMVAWLEQELRPGPVTDKGLQAFQSWVDARVVGGIVTFAKREQDLSAS